MSVWGLNMDLMFSRTANGSNSYLFDSNFPCSISLRSIKSFTRHKRKFSCETISFSDEMVLGGKSYDVIIVSRNVRQVHIGV